MAPSVNVPVDSHPPKDTSATKSRNTEPLKKSGALDAAFEFDDVTPTIGREYLTAQIVEDILNAPNADNLLRDLAITSQYLPRDQIRMNIQMLNHYIRTKSVNEASYSSASKKISPTTYRRSSSYAWGNCPEDPPAQLFTSILSSTIPASSASATPKSAPSLRSTGKIHISIPSASRCAKTSGIPRRHGTAIFNLKRYPLIIRVCVWSSYPRTGETHFGHQVRRCSTYAASGYQS